MRKKSTKRACDSFNSEIGSVLGFVEASSGMSDAHVSWCHDQAVIRLYRAFENLILTSLISALNNDTGQLSQASGISFPKHLTDEVCEYIIAGDGYFDFHGRSGLIKTIRLRTH